MAGRGRQHEVHSKPRPIPAPVSGPDHQPRRVAVSRHSSSLRDVELILAERGIVVVGTAGWLRGVLNARQLLHFAAHPPHLGYRLREHQPRGTSMATSRWVA